MADYFRNAFEGLKDTAQHLIEASREIQLAGSALVRTSEAVLAAKDEHEDLRETVHRLERLVLDQTEEMRHTRSELQATRTELQALRARLNGRS